jgi:hypothetical protein
MSPGSELMMELQRTSIEPRHISIEIDIFVLIFMQMNVIIFCSITLSSCDRKSGDRDSAMRSVPRACGSNSGSDMIPGCVCWNGLRDIAATSYSVGWPQGRTIDGAARSPSCLRSTLH